MRPIWTAPRFSVSSRSSAYLSSPSQVSSGPQKISSGSQTSSRPKPKPKVVKPMSSSATLPASTSRSAHEIFWPYFCLTGHSRRRAPLPAVTGAAAAVVDAVGARGVPAQPDHQAAVVAEVGRPPVLRGVEHLDEVAPELGEVELLELGGVAEVLAERVAVRRVAVQHGEVELVGPPVLVGVGPSTGLRGGRVECGVLALAPLCPLLGTVVRDGASILAHVFPSTGFTGHCVQR